eukprot:COSAG01_NODE_572_length_15298_cov_8.549172_5_plen_79_part_00
MWLAASHVSIASTQQCHGRAWLILIQYSTAAHTCTRILIPTQTAWQPAFSIQRYIRRPHTTGHWARGYCSPVPEVPMG